jgi:hypothetical protein
VVTSALGGDGKIVVTFVRPRESDLASVEIYRAATPARPTASAR